MEDDDYKLLINGKLVRGAATIDVINPATEELLAIAPRSDRDQLEEAIAAAKAAFPAWSATLIRTRGAILKRLADAIEVKHAEFSRLITLEQGKPLLRAIGEMNATIGLLRYFAEADLPMKVLKEDDKQKIVQRNVPLGVVAAIMPWNNPMLLMMIKVAPALLAGNTMVLKPAPTTPLTTLRFCELCANILPPGVVNVIVDQNDLGGALTTHPDIAKVAFTGSTATGKKVMEGASGTLKRLTLELGGNDAAIVLDDVDVKTVAPKILAAAMGNSGQVCLAAKRLYVHTSQYDEMCEELGRLATAMIVDDGLKQGTEMGPLQNRAQYEKVKTFLGDAKRDGKIVAGGDALDRKGYFIAPTIVRDLPDESRLVQEEQFGPILPVLRYETVEDAIARANDSEYGLGGTVWASNLDRAFEVASQIHTGTVWINKHLDLQADIPFAGSKQSGVGAEFGQEGLEQFTQPMVINMAK
ncbi:aldehyde dehydrogenase family protein [Paraburkholderia sp. GAS32]|uniref:aldehyde dehydrogenase family protein n=1 Tax=Paraburkholderia sp. GAS32 TaxID=3035129 RepID=UPI003D23CA73